MSDIDVLVQLQNSVATPILQRLNLILTIGQRDTQKNQIGKEDFKSRRHIIRKEIFIKLERRTKKIHEKLSPYTPLLDPWDQLISNQNLVKPIDTPKEALYTV